jgi:hypothetical protein
VTTPDSVSLCNVLLDPNRIDRCKQLKKKMMKLSRLLHDDPFNESRKTVANRGTDICSAQF